MFKKISKYYLSVCILGMISSCSSYKKSIGVTSHVSKDSVAEKSVETDYKDFFQRRMSNDEISKLKGSRCEILKEDGDYVYFGYPIDSVVMNPLKVRKDSLAGIFPKFAEIEGFHVKRKIYEQIIKPKEPNNYTNLAYKVNYDMSLIPEGIKVITNFKFSTDFIRNKKHTYEVLLDKNYLTIKELREL